MRISDGSSDVCSSDLRLFVHRPIQPARFTLMQARRIDKHDLAFRPVDDALDAMPRGLWLVRDDADLAAHQRVNQRTFADVGPTDDGDEAAMHTRTSALSRKRVV